MGKIFDALEKSTKKQNTSIVIDETPEIVVNRHPEDKNKDKEPTVFSYKASDRVRNSKREKQAVPFDRTEALYDYDKMDKNLVTLLNPRSFEAEQFKMLRTNLLFNVSGKSPRSIIVTSSVPSEGKSFVAANLSISIAQSIQEHVLLIDCDMRIPSIHKLFGFGDVPGLSEYLSNDRSLSSLILKTKVDKLSILPGGKPPHNPSELLSSQHMSNLLEEVKDRYRDRYIVIDTPPPKLTAETSAISRQVDGILLVVGYGSTPRRMVSDLIEVMGKEKILGVIFNKFDMQFSGSYGMGKYSKYVKYYAS